MSTLLILSSLLMASLFAYSASVQLNDPDWYFWLPLYVCAATVNLLNWVFSFNSSTVREISRFAMWFGVFLLVKVIVESCLVSGQVGVLSLDLSERLVREKTGSGLVVVSMILHLQMAKHHMRKRKNSNFLQKYLEHGMAVLVLISYGLPFFFFVIYKREMKL